MTTEEKLKELEKRVSILEQGGQRYSPLEEVIELTVKWPEADIGGLHFNEQKTRGFFEFKEDDNYYSRDILFLSARYTDKEMKRDLLTEYLDSEAVREAFQEAVGNHAIRVFIPKYNQGIKKYNGASCWYWLRLRHSGSAASFCYSGNDGCAGYNHASSVGGCAPAFRIGYNDTDNRGKEDD
jgi:hypothetical protein